jgi:choline dehydrogenase-like flavoprotein
MRKPEVDVVIAGAGGGGGVVAYELAHAGFQVALLERGRRQRFSETGHDELRSQRTTVLGNAFGPDDERHVRLVAGPGESGWRRVLPSEGPYNNIAACVGGGTFSYGAMAWRFLPQDFRLRSTYGAVEGSTLDDWPIRYEDLEPYYVKAEWTVGVSGRAGANPFEGPRSKGYPMPALPLNREASLLFPAARKLGWHPFPIPMAINSVPRDGRGACIGCPHCVGFACEAGAKNSTAVSVIPAAIATGLCELRTECVVKEILFDSRGRATGIAYFENGQLIEQPARVVVVACSATETARLLLNSRHRVHPRGLGNDHDWVGRNLQGHAYSGATAIFEQETWDGLGPAARVACCDFNHGNEGVVGGSMLANEFIRLPYLFSRSQHPPESRRWGIDHKRFQRDFYKRSMGIKGPVQEMPMWTSRVEIDPAVRDYWGIPVLRISGRKHPNDLRAGRVIADRAAEWLRAAGAVQVWTQVSGPGVSGGQHQAGTCRMSKDPKTGVADPFGRIHSSDNVYIADGSLHVTNGGFNPSLTIQALAFRVGEQITKTHRRATA